MSTADEIFRSELEKRRIEYSSTQDGRYEVRLDDHTVTISLENLRRNYDRDGDADAIARFAEGLVSDFFAETPSWEEVRPHVRYSLEPSDYETGFDDVLFSAVSDELNQVFVYTPADGSRITWMNESLLTEWGVTRDQVVRQAEENMAAILADAELEVREISGSGSLRNRDTGRLEPPSRKRTGPTMKEDRS